jgi:hypothetical protein
MNRKMILGALAALTAVGCAGPDPDPNNFTAPAAQDPGPAPANEATAGVKLDPSDPGLTQLAEAKPVLVRANPFALLPVEVAYDRSQLAASLNESSGFYRLVGVSQEVPPQPTMRFVEEPPRRLAGIMIGETVSALIDMNDGSPMQLIRPGTEVKNAQGQTTWIVESIDNERAILRRVEKNVQPTHIVVRLQNTLPTGGGATGGTGNTGGGGNQRGGDDAGRGGGAGRSRAD